MRMIIDAMGGDNAPLEILKGAVMSKDDLDVDITLVGDESIIRECASQNNIDISSMKIINATDTISMDDDPMSILKSKKDCSMAVGLKALKNGEGDAFISAGSTGALVVGGTFIVKRIRGIKRCAIASVLPADKTPFMLIDSGANNECAPEHLRQFGIMGSIYMNKVMGVESPRVGIANIGVEPEKGRDLQKQTYFLLKNENVNFTGMTEVRDIPFSAADVIVSDGFTGNIILKMYEGTAKFFSSNIKSILKKNIVTLFGAIFVKSGFDKLKKKMDYKEYGGAPLMGLKMPVIKAHGSADARTFKNAVKQAKKFVEQDVISLIEKSVPQKDTGD